MPEPKPVVSVIIPHFNRSDLLSETVDSLIAQTYTDWEAIIVDDGSDAEHRAALPAIAADNRIRLLNRERSPKGPSTCRNIGLEKACGEYVIFLDSDDLLAPWCLESRVDEMRRRPELDLLVSHVLLFENVPGDCELLWNRLTDADNDRSNALQRFLTQSPPWCVTSPIWKRDSLQRIGGFNENVVYGDDSDLHTRALLTDLPYRISERSIPDVFIRRSDASRITNTLSEALLQSRLRRLTEGSAAIAEHPEASRLWSGQYFVEAEFRLFNVDAPSAEIQKVLAAWWHHQRPAIFHWFIVRTYFRIALTVKCTSVPVAANRTSGCDYAASLAITFPARRPSRTNCSIRKL